MNITSKQKSKDCQLVNLVEEKNFLKPQNYIVLSKKTSFKNFTALMQ